MHALNGTQNDVRSKQTTSGVQKGANGATAPWHPR